MTDGTCIEWAEMQRTVPPKLVSVWRTKEEAVANCYAEEVSRQQREQELKEREFREGKKFFSFGPNAPFVAFRRVSDWTEYEQEAEAA